MWEDVLKQKDFLIRVGLQAADFYIQRVGSGWPRTGSMHMDWPKSKSQGTPMHRDTVIGVKVINPDIDPKEVAMYYGKMHRTRQTEKYITGSVQQKINVRNIREILDDFEMVELYDENRRAIEKLPELFSSWKKQTDLIGKLMLHSDKYHQKGLDIQSFLKRI